MGYDAPTTQEQALAKAALLETSLADIIVSQSTALEVDPWWFDAVGRLSHIESEAHDAIDSDAPKPDLVKAAQAELLSLETDTNRAESVAFTAPATQAAAAMRSATDSAEKLVALLGALPGSTPLVTPGGGGGGPPVPPFKPTPLALAAKAFLLAWTDLRPNTPPPANGLELALAWSIGEGAYAATFRGSNNCGAMHATRAFAEEHGSEPGYGMLAHLDTLSRTEAYIARMMVFPSLRKGAGAFLALVDRFVDLVSVFNRTEFAFRMYVNGYYSGVETPRTPLPQRKAAFANGTQTEADTKNVAAGFALLGNHEKEAANAFAAAPSEPGDPSVVGVGPFASLAERLTPGRPPHTLEHARALLGHNADAPTTGISLADALASPTGDGVWLFPLPKAAPKPKPAPAPEPVAKAGGLSTGATVALTILTAALGVAGGVAVVRAQRERQAA